MSTRDSSGRFLSAKPPIPILIAEGALVPLTNGGYALIDAEDIPRVDRFAWYAKKQPRKNLVYAYSYIWRDGRRRHLAMHRHLFGLGPDDPRVLVDHKNHDGLDNRRSVNLRLATHRQNSLNSRKGWLGSSSRFKGASFDKSLSKWHAKIGLTDKGRYRVRHLGLYGTEAEAAFAYSVAAPLLHDPQFINLPAIPPDCLPGENRRGEIEREVVERIKNLLRGEKGRPGVHSRFRGVCKFVDNGSTLWQVTARVDGKGVYLGRYATEIEAAIAYNLSLGMNAKSRFGPNLVPADCLPSAEMIEAIRTKVAGKIAKACAVQVQESHAI